MQRIYFYALTNLPNPGLDIWHYNRPARSPLVRIKGTPVTEHPGWWQFTAELPRTLPLDFKLTGWNQTGSGICVQEPEAFKRSLNVPPGTDLPEAVWLVEGSNRVLLQDPFATTVTRVKIHLITAAKFRRGELFVWTPVEAGRKVAAAPERDDEGWPCFELTLPPNLQSAFNFKFISPEGQFENDYANRTWSGTDGAEIWTHSDGATLLAAKPQKKQLTIHFRHEWSSKVQAWMHLWQESSAYQEDLPVVPDSGGGWCQCTKNGLYTGIPYGLLFTSALSTDPLDWENQTARRYLTLTDDAEYWVLEGDPALFTVEPQPNQPVVVTIAHRDPQLTRMEPDMMEVKIHKARAPLAQPRYERRPDGTWIFWTYPQVVTSFRFGCDPAWEPEYHRIKTPEPSVSPSELTTTIVWGRYPCLNSAPPADQFQDPPYLITRPGMTVEAGYLRFAFHAPWCARVRLRGEWLDQPAELHSTRDGAYWWTQMPLADVTAGLPASFGSDYHGARYQLILNDPSTDPANDNLNGAKNVQDPAANWVETTAPSGFSKLVNHRRYQWRSDDWQTPGAEYLMVYQIHPSRFIRRSSDPAPLVQVAREIESGYLADLGITALLLMPVNEYSGNHGWGYNPSYYYAVEQAYGEPDDLKLLVDTCHQHGIAVLLDVVFNHVGCDDNILWEVARNSFGRGDTIWGMMPDFQHPQVRHFFAQNLQYWRQEFRLDGFRFDHTKTIIENANPSYFSIRKPSTGGGWEFLNELRQTVKSLDPKCLFMAEQLPNDWAVTNYGGPMDTQWGDAFHDRTVDLSKGFPDQTGALATALQLTQTSCQEWYNITAYSESHDEVGNVNDRIANIGGYRKGLRRNKVAATATLFSRGIPLLFMGEEAGESGQFCFDSTQPLDLERYTTDPNNQRVRDWWKTLLHLRKHNNRIQGPAPLTVHYVEDLLLAFSRGETQDYFVVVNFGDGPVTRNLGQINLPGGNYRELWNSTWPAFQVEFEDEHTNGGREAWLNRTSQLQIPDYGAIVLEKRS
jgi:1,4-alpha-glucan branching enzyme